MSIRKFSGLLKTTVIVGGAVALLYGGAALAASGGGSGDYVTMSQLSSNISDTVSNSQKIITATLVGIAIFLFGVAIHYMSKHLKTRESGGTHILSSLTFFGLGCVCLALPQVSKLITGSFLGSNDSYEQVDGSKMNQLINSGNSGGGGGN